MVCADGRKFRFWLFHFAKNSLFFQQKFMSQALYLREFLETYDEASLQSMAVPHSRFFLIKSVRAPEKNISQ